MSFIVIIENSICSNGYADLDLPEPPLPFIKQLKSAKVSQNLEDASPQGQQPPSPEAKPSNSGATPSKSRRLRKDSLENLDNDPWASPALHANHTHTVHNEATPKAHATVAKPLRNGLSEPSRTTSAFTTHSEDATSSSPTLAGGQSADGAGDGWGSDRPTSGSFTDTAQSGPHGGGFGSSGDDQDNRPGGRRSLGGGRTYNRGVEETVTVTLLPEKEGMFMFQHHNYEVKCIRKASSVVRRYSDFVWLLDCLHKRYPFRQLPLLPPKRVAGNALPKV